MKRVCVYSGSSAGTRPEYTTAAERLASALVGRGIDVVFGGGNVGLMKVVADTALAQGGRVIGMIPEALMAREIGHLDLTELHVVASMHERKAMMEELSDGFVALPGGFGTIEEIIEMATWAQLGLHTKPFGLVDVAASTSTSSRSSITRSPKASSVRSTARCCSFRRSRAVARRVRRTRSRRPSTSGSTATKPEARHDQCWRCDGRVGRL